MRFVLIPTLAAVSALTACTGSKGAGNGLRIEPLPAQVEAPCRHPSEFLGAGDWELIAGRIGDELIACSAEKQIAVDGYNGIRRAVE